MFAIDASSRRRRAGPLATLLGALAVSGCTVIRIEGPAGEVEVRRELGLAVIEIRPASSPLVLEATSLGAARGIEGWAIGFRSATLAALPADRCQTVIWAHQGEAQLAQWRELLKDSTQACVLPHAFTSKGTTR